MRLVDDAIERDLRARSGPGHGECQILTRLSSTARALQERGDLAVAVCAAGLVAAAPSVV